MSVPILCPFCGVSGSAPDKARGTLCRCPKCGNRFKVPELVSAAEIKAVSSPPPIRHAVTEDRFDFGVHKTMGAAEPPQPEARKLNQKIMIALLGGATVLAGLTAWIIYERNRPPRTIREAWNKVLDTPISELKEVLKQEQNEKQGPKTRKPLGEILNWDKMTSQAEKIAFDEIVQHRFWKRKLTDKDIKPLIQRVMEGHSDEVLVVDDEGHWVVGEGCPPGLPEKADKEILMSGWNVITNVRAPLGLAIYVPKGLKLRERSIWLHFGSYSKRPTKTELINDLKSLLDRAEFQPEEK